MPATIVAGALQTTARTALPCLVGSPLRLRNFTSSTVRFKLNKDEPGPKDFSQGSHFQRIEYVLSETPEPTQEDLIAQLQDEQISHLPLVVRSGNRWRIAADTGLTLPRRDRSDIDSSPYACGEYVYNTFHLPTIQHLKRFNAEIAEKLLGKGKPTQPVLLLDPRSLTLTIGLPAHVGIEPPYPAKKNSQMVSSWLQQYRDEASTDEQKKALMRKLRKYVIPHGFKRTYHIFSIYVVQLFESMRTKQLEQLQGGQAAASDSSRIEENIPVDVGSSSTRAVAQEASEAWQAQRKDGERGDGDASSPGLAERLREYNAKLPEAETFVAQDGDAHKADGEGETLEEHVPVPTPSAEEMGMKKPTEI